MAELAPDLALVELHRRPERFVQRMISSGATTSTTTKSRTQGQGSGAKFTAAERLRTDFDAEHMSSHSMNHQQLQQHSGGSSPAIAVRGRAKRHLRSPAP